jgi:FkbM family methyltransferase
VFAFEPGSPFEKLAEMPGISAHNIALGSKAGTQVFSENSTSVMSSFLPLGPEGWGRITGQREVVVSTVDEFCEQRGIGFIDLLKSDTQGYDLEVLRGGDRMFTEGRIHLVYLEATFAPLYENLPRFDQLYGFLADRDFDLVGLYDIHYRNDKIGWADALFARRQAIRTHAEAPRQRT